jgi:hypothetical protein
MRGTQRTRDFVYQSAVKREVFENAACYLGNKFSDGECSDSSSQLVKGCSLLLKLLRNFFRADLQNLAVFDHDGVLAKAHFSF